MKYIITESSYKNILFRYWDKVGGKVDNTFINFFGLDRNKDISYETVYKYLIEWRGEEESKELAKNLLLKNPHHIDDFGTYDFFFDVTKIWDWYFTDEPKVSVKILVDDVNGSLVLPEGEDERLEDALDNEDYGWEIESEVDWGLDEYFNKKITSQTGIKVIFDKPKYKSRIFNIR